LDRSFFHFVTNHTFDRQTDGQTEFSSLDENSHRLHCMQCGKKCKILNKLNLVKKILLTNTET